MRRVHEKQYSEIATPADFNFEECLVHLGRSSQENLYRLDDSGITKLLKIGEQLVLFRILRIAGALRIEFPLGVPTFQERDEVAAYIEDWFDLQTDLQGFYAMAETDPVLNGVVRRHYGLRVIGVPDLFEALVWAVMGQQINLTFAYTLKKRFVENFGESLVYENERYWTFPSAEKIAGLNVADLRALQLDRKPTPAEIMELAKNWEGWQAYATFYLWRSLL